MFFFLSICTILGWFHIHYGSLCWLQRLDWSSSSSASSVKDCILLAACEAHQTLPQSAEYPADVFTACLTTPIKMALHWFSLSLSLMRSCQSSVVCLAVYGLCSPPSDFSWHLSWSVNLSTNYAGFVNDRYSVVLWTTLLLTKFLEGKMTVKHFWGSWTGFSLLLQILLHGMFFLMVQKVIWVQK